MELNLQQPTPRRIAAAPPGRGRRPRPEVNINSDYVRKLLEEARLTERDETLLKYLDELPVLTARQIKRLLWTNSTTSNLNRRLRALYDYHLLDRVRMINKQHGITYTLGKAGRLWLHGEQTRSSRAPQVNVPRLSHDLVMAEVIVRLIEELRQRDPTGRQYRLEWAGPDNSRFIHQDKVIVAADGRLRISTGSARQTFLLEIDMSTERAGAFQSKVKRYHQAYTRPGLRDEHNTLAVVLVVTTVPRRVDLLAEVIAGVQQAANIPLAWALAPLSNLPQFYSQPWTIVKQGKIQTQLLADIT